MRIFSRLFDSPDVRAAKEIIRDTKRQFGPIFNVAQGIMKAAGACAEPVRPLMNFPTEEKNGENWIYVLFEFVFFFIHLTSRSAFSILGDEGRSKLAKELSPLIVPPIIEGLFGHWPQKYKDGIRHDFYKNLDNAELEYGACKEFLSTDKPFTGDGLLNKLARNVAELVGKPMDTLFMAKVMEVASDSFAEMKLNQMMRDLKESGFLHSSLITEGELEQAKAALLNKQASGNA